MKLGIITINFNNYQGLLKTTSSVFKQTFRDFEYLVIDGGSVDGSIDYLRQISDQLTYWVSEPDNGVYNAMNKGIKHSSAEYLLFLNSGDILLDDNVLNKVAPYFEKAEIIYGDIRFDHGNRLEDFIYPERLTFGYFYERSLGHPCAFIKKEIFKRLGYYEEQYEICADWVFFIRAICLFQISYLHIPIVISIFNMDGISNYPENQLKINQEKQELFARDFPLFTEEYLELKELRQIFNQSKSSSTDRHLLSRIRFWLKKRFPI